MMAVHLHFENIIGNGLDIMQQVVQIAAGLCEYQKQNSLKLPTVLNRDQSIVSPETYLHFQLEFGRHDGAAAGHKSARY